MQRRVAFVTGPPAAGKSTTRKRLEGKGVAGFDLDGWLARARDELSVGHKPFWWREQWEEYLASETNAAKWEDFCRDRLTEREWTNAAVEGCHLEVEPIERGVLGALDALAVPSEAVGRFLIIEPAATLLARMTGRLELGARDGFHAGGFVSETHLAEARDIDGSEEQFAEQSADYLARTLVRGYSVHTLDEAINAIATFVGATPDIKAEY
jgi:hypothetical protein